MKMKKILTMALIVAMMGAMAISLSSCGDSDTLKVVTEATFEPFEFCEDGSDEIQGFDVDLMNAIAEDQDLKIEFVNMEFDSLIPSLDSGEGDIVAAGMNKLSGDRAEKADFGDTYYESDLMLVVTADSDLSGIDAVTSDMKLASQIGTTGGDYIQTLEEEGKIAKAVVLNQWTDCYMQLQNGDVQGVVVDLPVGNNYVTKNPDIAKFAGDKFGDHEEYAFAVKKGNTELLDKLNAGLANMKDNGTYDELVAKWFS